MNALYSSLGITRQAHFQQLSRNRKQLSYEQYLVKSVAELRSIHPRMGLRKLHHLLNPEIGRDRFEAIMKSHGLQLKKLRNYMRTTFSSRYNIYPNLISGLVLTQPNQVWVSDITYYRSSDKFYYLTLILDVYTRKIVGWQVSDTLRAEANVSALRMALKKEKGCLRYLIHHSDRGSQYASNKYTQLLKQHKIRVSMGNKAWENAHAERLNGIIKQEYLFEGQNVDIKKLNPVSFERLKEKDNLMYKVKINY
jgi:putative transposase